MLSSRRLLYSSSMQLIKQGMLNYQTVNQQVQMEKTNVAFSLYWQQSDGLDLFCHYLTYLIPVNAATASSDLLLHVEVLTRVNSQSFLENNAV